MYTTFYDVLSRRDLIHPDYRIYGIYFVVCAILLIVALAVFIYRTSKDWWLSVVCLLLILACGLACYRDYQTYATVRSMIARREVQTVEGCLERFHPGRAMGGRARDTHELWRVAGTDFEYSTGQWGPGFAWTKGAGGPVDARSRVRATFISADVLFPARRIVRLDIREGACQPARDSGF